MISNIFPLFKIILYLLKKSTQHIKMSFTKRKLTGIIFENSKITLKKLFPKKIEELNKNPKVPNNKLTLSNKSEYELMKDKIINNNESNKLSDLNYNKEINLFKNTKKNKENNNNISIYNNTINNKLNIFLNNEINIKKLNLKQFSLINLNKKSSSIYDPIKSKKLTKNKKNEYKKEKYLFPYYYYFLEIVFDNLISPQKFTCVPKAYLTVYNFMCNIYDISTHLILFKQYNILNHIVTEKVYQEKGKTICDYKLYKKININDNSIMEKISKNLGMKDKKHIFYSNYFV